MKKALVLLLILAVAGGIFAQDLSVGVSGEVRLGFDTAFAGKAFKDAEMVVNPDHNYGLATLNFDKGAAHFDLGFKATYGYGESDPDFVVTDYNDSDDPEDWDIIVFDEGGETVASFGGSFTATAEYGDGVNGDTATPFKVHAGVTMGNGFVFGVDSLYGYWLFWDRQIKVDVAYAGYETIYWRVSDIVASDWDNLDGMGGVAISFMPDFLSGLNVGIFFPGQTHAGAFPSATPGFFAGDFLQKIVVGAKYEMDVFGFSAMFKGDNKSAQAFNLGATYSGIDRLSISFDAQMDNLGDFSEQGAMAFGLNGEFAPAPFTIGLTAKFIIAKSMADPEDPTDIAYGGKFNSLSIKPYFYWDLVEDTLQWRLIPELVFAFGDYEQKALNFETDLFWNMNRDGVTDDPAHGLLISYKLGFDFDDKLKSSDLGVYFRWAF